MLNQRITGLYALRRLTAARLPQNIEKHGIDLETVKKIFDDPFRIMQYDVAHSGLEDRWQILGMANGVLFVVYTERGEKIRIITAREATPEERRLYYGENENFCFSNCGVLNT